MKLFGKLFEWIGWNFIFLANKLYKKKRSEREEQTHFFCNTGDKTLRLDYDNLDNNSIVFDLGGFHGDWSSDIFAKYGCTVFVFEPVSEYANYIRNRFKHNNKIIVFDFGLSGKDAKIEITKAGVGSSVFRENTGAEKEWIHLHSFASFLHEKNINHIDLLKINIEGGEYDLLEHIVETNCIKSIRDIQVQFHDFVPNAKERMYKIQRFLIATHTPTYQYEFVWENWRKK